MSKIKLGCIGMGCRGTCMLETMLKMCDNAEIVAVCDLYEDRAEKGGQMVKESKGYMPFVTTCADDIMKMDEVEAVLIFAAWESHIPLAISAMEHGKYVGLEVGGAYSIADCYRLIETHRRTGVQCMMLENCCYGKTELSVLNMVRAGVFGEVVHCSGCYRHDLRNEVAGGNKNRHYRLRNYRSRNCENYPTHELGPIAKVLNINRGNRMLTLSSFASKGRGLEAYIKENAAEYPELQDTKFAQGDVVTTVITCADGSTIVLTLDTTLPCVYSRGFTVRGTKAAYFEDNNSLIIDGPDIDEWGGKKYWDNAVQPKEDYKHPLWEKYEEVAKEAGHDGMDFMVLSAFLEAVSKNAVPPIDVYDTAAWMSITALSEESIARGGAPVSIPDFTDGAWQNYKKEDSGLEFTLD